MTFLTCLHINVVDARKLAKKTIETENSTELHLFLGNYKVEKQSQLALKKTAKKNW